MSENYKTLRRITEERRTPSKLLWDNTNTKCHTYTFQSHHLVYHYSIAINSINTIT